MKKIFTLFNLIYFSTLYSQNQECNNILIEDNFETLHSDWEFTGNKVFYNNGTIKFDNSYGLEENRAIRELSRTVSDTYFKLEVKIKIDGPNPNGNGSIANVFSLTETTEDMSSINVGGSWQESDNNCLGLILLSNDYLDENMSNWFFLVEQKLGTSRTWDMNTKIYLDPLITEYYVVFERLSLGECKIAIYSDALHTNHINGSPQTIPISEEITNLLYTQHGGMYSANENRTINASIDDLIICDNFNPLNETIKIDTNENLVIFPNPIQDEIKIKYPFEISLVQFINSEGKIVSSISNDFNHINCSNLADGHYILKIITKDKTLFTNFIKL